jgi:ABC-type transporter Mla subunit MlaD
MQEAGEGRLARLLEEATRALLQRSDKQASRIEAVMARLDELAEESKAQSQAIFILIDRLPPPDR